VKLICLILGQLGETDRWQFDLNWEGLMHLQRGALSRFFCHLCLIAGSLAANAGELWEAPASRPGLPPVAYLRIGAGGDVVAPDVPKPKPLEESRVWQRGGQSGTINAVGFAADGRFASSSFGM